MADRKITDLTALAAGSQATGDLLTIVDVSESAAADKNKKITVENLFKGIPGNVGIGTSAPTVLLDLESTSPTIRLTDSDASGTPECQISGAGGDLVFEADRDNEKSDSLIRFEVDGSERLVIDSNGKVGIGHSTPQFGLTLPQSANDTGAIGWEDGGNSKRASIRCNTSGDALQFNTGTGDIERMRIDSSGNVGIGISSPASILHVVKNSTNNTPLSHNYPATQSGVLVSNNQTGTTGAFSAVTLRAYNSLGSGQSASIIAQSTGSGYSPSLLFTQRSGSGTNAERMRIDSSGNVGIGTTSPGNRLHVASTVSAVARYECTSGTSTYTRFENTDNARGYVGYEGKRLVFYADNGSDTSDKKLGVWDADGLKFGSDTAAANALEDYEEGTWTPSVTDSGYTTSTSTGHYTKIGRLVTVHFRIQFSAIGSNTSSTNFSGLPFTVNSAFHMAGVCRESTTSGDIFVAQVNQNSTNCSLNSLDGVASGSNQIFATGRNYDATISYFV